MIKIISKAVLACLLAVSAHATVDEPELEKEIDLGTRKNDHFYSDVSSETTEYAITQRFVGGG